MRPITVAASRIKRIFDTFDSNNLVQTREGSRWNKRRGDWSESSSKVSSSTLASEYPMSTVSIPQSSKVTMSLKGVSQGAGAALWVTDSGNWWAISVQQDGATNCNCQQCEQCNAYQCNATGCVCGWWCAGYGCTGNYNTSNCTGYNTSNCTGYNTSNCQGYRCSSYSYNSKNKTYVCNGYICNGYNGSNCKGYNGSNCKGYNGSNCNAEGCTDLRCGCYGCTSSSCSSSSLVDCNCQTCYPPYIRLLQSVGNTVSQITQWALSSVANSIKVIATGTGISIKAYSDENLASQIGSDLTYTPTGATITTNYGIIVTPSAYNQGSSVDEISIENI
jgi:hypothetical protein